jgi:hypothetical protein
MTDNVAGMVGSSAADHFSSFHADVEFGVGQQDGKLISAIAAHEIALPHQLLQPCADRTEHAVSRDVTVGIIHPFELIEIGKNQHEQGSLPSPFVHQQMEFLVECFAIGNASQVVAAGLARRMIDLLGLFLQAIAGAQQIFLHLPVCS